MAATEVTPLKDRKALLVLQSEVLRRELSASAEDLQGMAHWVEKGYSLARTGQMLWSCTAPVRKTQRKLSLGLPGALIRFLSRRM